MHYDRAETVSYQTWRDPAIFADLRIKHLHQGALIGKVTKINFTRTEDENQVVVTIRVVKEKAHLIRTDSLAEVIAPTLIGSQPATFRPKHGGRR